MCDKEAMAVNNTRGSSWTTAGLLIAALNRIPCLILQLCKGRLGLSIKDTLHLQLGTGTRDFRHVDSLNEIDNWVKRGDKYGMLRLVANLEGFVLSR